MHDALSWERSWSLAAPGRDLQRVCGVSKGLPAACLPHTHLAPRCHAICPWRVAGQHRPSALGEQAARSGADGQQTLLWLRISLRSSISLLLTRWCSHRRVFDRWGQWDPVVG